MDYHKEEIDLWNSKLSWADVEKFCASNKVEVLMQADCQYHCYINFKKGDGADAVCLTFVGALKQGIYTFVNNH